MVYKLLIRYEGSSKEGKWRKYSGRGPEYLLYEQRGKESAGDHEVILYSDGRRDIVEVWSRELGKPPFKV